MKEQRLTYDSNAEGKGHTSVLKKHKKNGCSKKGRRERELPKWPEQVSKIIYQRLPDSLLALSWKTEQ